MSRRGKWAGQPGHRPAHPERRLQSLNDWYGLGVLSAIFNQPGAAGVRYVGKRAITNQYVRGLRDGREIRQGRDPGLE